MRFKIIFILIFILFSFSKQMLADIILYNGEAPETDAVDDGSITDPYWECWWGCTNHFVDTNYNTHTGTNCGIWTYPAGNSSGGIFYIDPTWGGKNVSHMTNFELWVRSDTGNEKAELRFKDTVADASFATILAPVSWTQYSFSKSVISNANPSFNFEKLVGLVIANSGTFSGNPIYFDDMIIRTCGAPEMIFLDGDKSQSSAHPILSWVGTIAAKTTNYNPHAGSYCEKLSGDSDNANGGIFNEGWGIWDVSGNINFEFWIKAGTTTGIRFILRDGNDTEATPIDVSGLTTNWTKVSVPISTLTNTGFNPETFKSIKVDFHFGAGSVFIDDMKFPAVGELTLSDPSVSPSTISNNKANSVTFTVNVSSLGVGGGPGSPAGATINMSSINGPTNAVMTNVTGNLYRYTYITPYGLKTIGTRWISITATNQEGLIKTTNISLNVINAFIPVITNENCSPSTITNTSDKQVILSLKAVSDITDIKSVSIDLSGIGGSASSLMTNMSGATLWQYTYTVPQGTPGGWKSLVVTATDYYNSVGTSSISLLIISYPKIPVKTATPSTINNNIDNSVTFNIKAISEVTQIKKVSLDLSSIAGPSNAAMSNAPATQLTNWQYTYLVPAGLKAGPKSVVVSVTDQLNLSTVSTMTLFLRDTISPTTPTNFSLAVNLNNAILNWSSSTDESGILGYRVYRGIYSGIYDYWTNVGNILSWTDKGLEWDKRYYYVVSALDTSSNESSLSIEKSFKLTNNLIVYDGDTVDANIVGTGGSAVLKTTNYPPITGTYSALFSDSGSSGYAQHQYSASGVDISKMNFFSFNVQAESGNTGYVSIVPYFYNDQYNFNNSIVLSNISTTSTNIVVQLYDITNGTGLDATRFQGLYFGGFDGRDFTHSFNGTLYFDDMKFVKAHLSVTKFESVPLQITNNKSTIITFTAEFESDAGVSNATINLSSIGGSSNALMTNISGNTSFRYTFNCPVGISGGNQNTFVTVKDVLGNSQSGAISIMVVDKIPPQTPSFVSATPLNNKAVLIWTVSTDETSLAGYKLYRGTSSGNYTFINFVGNRTSYTDTEVVNGTKYFYAVSAIDTSSNESGLSSEINVTPQIVKVNIIEAAVNPAIITNTSSYTLVFTVTAKSPDIVDVTNVTIDLTPINLGSKKMTNISGWTNWRYSCNIPVSISAGDKIFSVTAVDENNNNGTTNILLQIIDKKSPTKPTTLTAIGSKLGIKLQWGKSIDETGILGYKLLRGTSSGNYTETNFIVGDISSWEDTYALSPDITYYYVLIAVDTSSNESPPSNEVTAVMEGLTGLIQVRGNYVVTSGDDNYPEIYVEILEDGTTLKVNIYDVLGNLVKSIVNSKVNRGIHTFKWKLDNQYGEKISSGLYMATIRINDKTPVIKKIMVVK